MNNKTKIFIGLLLIIVAFVCVIAVSYSIDQRNKESIQETDALQVQLANLISEKSQNFLSESDQEKVKRDPIKIEDILAKAEIIYGDQELSRKDGVLWVDRKSLRCMVTLGVVNGLVSGSYLGVYDEKKRDDGVIVNEKIADVMVDKAYDIISYVSPVKKSLDDFSRDYYRVTVKNPL
ncbi:MAG: hypothetical protein PHY73_01940 [Candidatus Omnitrophica bacterium]|nr:hypothetical protein [Candidatus Omnitrophota bacterium]